MPKVCSRRSCKRLAEGKFKLCANCHLSHTNQQKKQKRLKLEALLESEENKVC